MTSIQKPFGRAKVKEIKKLLTLITIGNSRTPIRITYVNTEIFLLFHSIYLCVLNCPNVLKCIYHVDIALRYKSKITLNRCSTFLTF